MPPLLGARGGGMDGLRGGQTHRDAGAVVREVAEWGESVASLPPRVLGGLLLLLLKRLLLRPCRLLRLLSRLLRSLLRPGRLLLRLLLRQGRLLRLLCKKRLLLRPCRLLLLRHRRLLRLERQSRLLRLPLHLLLGCLVCPLLRSLPLVLLCLGTLPACRGGRMGRVSLLRRWCPVAGPAVLAHLLVEEPGKPLNLSGEPVRELREEMLHHLFRCCPQARHAALGDESRADNVICQG